MKKIKILALGLIAALSMNSCLVDDESSADYLAETPFVIGFDTLEKVHIFVPTDVDVVTDEVFISVEGGNNGSTGSSRSLTYTVDVTNPAFTILNESNTFVIPVGNTVASEPLRYSIDPTALSSGETLNISVTLVPSTDNIVTTEHSPLVINIQKCDPPLSGEYTSANDSLNPGVNGEAITITPLGCDDTYRASNIPIFNGTFSFEFSHDTATGTITVLGSEEIEGAFGGTVSGDGTVLGNGTIQFTNFVVTAGGLSGYSFDAVPN